MAELYIVIQTKKRNLWKMNVKINNFQSMVFFYIKHVATCICLRNFEKRKFKIWRETLFKRRVRVTLPHQSLGK